MIARLLRHDRVLVVQLTVFVIVAALVSWEVNSSYGIDGQHPGMSRGLLPDGGLGRLGTLQLGAFAVFISAYARLLNAAKRGAVHGFFSRYRPLDLMLPIAPRSAWCALLIAHGISIAVPLLTTWLIVSILGQSPVLPVLWKIAAASATVVLYLFGRSPERATHWGLRGLLGMVSVIVLSGLLLALDWGAFQDAAPVHYRFGIEIALGIAAVWALRAYRRLPQSWSLPADNSAALMRNRRPANSASATETQLRPSQWSASKSKLRAWSMLVHSPIPVTWPLFGAVFSLLVSSFFMMALFLSKGPHGMAPAWAVTVIVLAAQRVRTDSQFLATLPITRRRLLGVVLGPLAVALALGIALGVSLSSQQLDRDPVVTLRRQQLDSSPGPQWVGVTVPVHHWRLAGLDGIPDQISPDGERITPLAMHLKGLGFLTVYNPFEVPRGSSQAFTAWQFSRALQAEFGVSLESDGLSERYLETYPNGRVVISEQPTKRSLAEHEAGELGERPWPGLLTGKHPKTLARWDARRAALSVLFVVVLATLLGSLQFRVRAGTRIAKPATISMYLPPMLSIPYIIVSWTPLESPLALLPIAGNTLLSLLPDSALFVWLLTAAVAVIGFNILARGLDRAEFIARKAPQ